MGGEGSDYCFLINDLPKDLGDKDNSIKQKVFPKVYPPICISLISSLSLDDWDVDTSLLESWLVYDEIALLNGTNKSVEGIIVLQYWKGLGSPLIVISHPLWGYFKHWWKVYAIAYIEWIQGHPNRIL